MRSPTRAAVQSSVRQPWVLEQEFFQRFAVGVVEPRRATGMELGGELLGMFASELDLGTRLALDFEGFLG